MLLKSLKMVNFRQYKGETNISFSCDKEKNVTIILGDNTFGKTTLLQAFNWCFYQSASLPSPDFLLNYDIAGLLQLGETAEVEVEIQLIHSGIEYVLTRSQEYIKIKNSVLPQDTKMKVSYKEKDGQTQNIKESKIDNIINTILPKDLSTYFFFDTERVGSVSDRKDLADSVKGLLGLTVLDNAIKHIGTKTNKKSVIGQFYGSMDFDGDQRAKEALNKIQDTQTRRDTIATQLETSTSEIKYYEGRKEQLETILRDNQNTATLQKRKEALERSVLQELNAQKDIIKVLLSEFSAESKYFYSQPLLKRASDFLREAKIDDKGIKDLTKVTLEDIIKRGRCICGCELTEGSDALKHIMEEMRFVPPESIGNTVRNYKDRISTFEKPSERIFQSIKTRYEEIYRSKTRVQDWNDDIEDISERIKDKDDMNKFEVELVDVKNRLRDLNSKRERLIRDDEALKNDIDRYQKIYDGLIAVSGKNKSTMLYIRYSEEIRDWLVTTYKEKESFIREDLEEKVNNIFGEMYHGHRRVSIDSKYQVTLLTTVSNKEIESGESEGLNRVKNFAFIAGLVALAKEKIISTAGEKEFDLSSEPYPLVMDAPFSNADETHTSNISRVLPEVAEQVVMFVMQKDWRYAEAVISNRVGSKYRLIKHSEQYSEVKGV